MAGLICAHMLRIPPSLGAWRPLGWQVDISIYDRHTAAKQLASMIAHKGGAAETGWRYTSAALEEYT